MCIELENKKAKKNHAPEGQDNANKDSQINKKNPILKDGNILSTEKLDEELQEINNEIRYIRKLQAKHQELIH